ncbi:fibrillin-1-like [Hydra vulgaris]|uniref:fibrillin-1-like n=1 Tax=Hydra vulgaris TaxID=6087 RepID=UPI0032EA3B52
MSVTNALLNDTITDNATMICPPILDKAVQGGFVNRIVACSFNKQNCSYQISGFNKSIDNPSARLPNSSFNPSNGPGYIYGNIGSFRIDVPASLYDDIKNFDLYITIGYFFAKGAYFFGVANTNRIFYNYSSLLTNSSYTVNWVVLNARYPLTSPGFNFNLYGNGDFIRFDDVCIYQVCKIGFAFNDTSNLCQDFDECALSSTNNCTANASCNNFIGGYNCTCKSGFNASNGDIELLSNLCLGINLKYLIF